MEYDAALDRALRAAVISLRARSARRRPPPVLHAGFPEGALVTVDAHQCGDATAWDHGLRTEIASALISAAGARCALVWLTRPGMPIWHDQDAAWTGPVRAAWAEHGVADGRFAVVTPRGWYDPISGAGRRWRRPREHD